MNLTPCIYWWSMELAMCESFATKRDGLYYIPTSTGVVIFPEDLSYRRFISNSMYDNQGNR